MTVKKLLRRPLTIGEILSWAEAHREATGKWPTHKCGSVIATKFESWANVDSALQQGLRGLPGNSSLARLLAQKKGARNIQALPDLAEQQILQWADDFRKATGKWPTNKSGIIPNSGGDKWHLIENALRFGTRGLPGGSSIAKLLAIHRGKRNRKQLPPLTQEQILQWADQHFQRAG